MSSDIIDLWRTKVKTKMESTGYQVGDDLTLFLHSTLNLTIFIVLV